MRRVLPSVLVVLATLLAFLAIFALWANRQLLDTDNWVETSTSVLENQDVQEQLSIFLVDELYTNVDVQARIQEALPPRADVLAGPAAGGLKGLLEDAVDALLDRPRCHRTHGRTPTVLLTSASSRSSRTKERPFRPRAATSCST